jgi:hypothetical protein
MALDTARAPTPASRKIRRLGITVAVIVALYSAGWFYVASKIEETVRNFIARPGPVELACDGLTRTGTPFRIGFACNRTSVKDEVSGGMLSAGAIHAVANIYNPGSAIVELTGPADISLLDGTAVTANWTLLRSGFSLGFSGLKTLSNTGENLSVDLFNYAMVEPIVAKAKHGEFHIRGNGADVDVAMLANDFALATKSGAEILPTLSTSTELTLKDKAELLEGKPLLSKAMMGTLTSVKIATPDGLFGELSGPFEIDEEGYISGTFKTRLEKLDLWEANLLKLFPKAGSTISGMTALLKGLAKGGDTVTVNLVVDKGRITLSMFPLGHIPPL